MPTKRTTIVSTVTSASTSPGFTNREPHRPEVVAVRSELLSTMAGLAVVRELKWEMMDSGIRVGREKVGEGKQAAPHTSKGPSTQNTCMSVSRQLRPEPL